MKYTFSTKIWFVKTSTRIVKYKSQAVKSNPGVGKLPIQWGKLNGKPKNFSLLIIFRIMLIWQAKWSVVFISLMLL